MDENGQELFLHILAFFRAFFDSDEILPPKIMLCKKHAWSRMSGNYDGFQIFP